MDWICFGFAGCWCSISMLFAPLCVTCFFSVALSSSLSAPTCCASCPMPSHLTYSMLAECRTSVVEHGSQMKQDTVSRLPRTWVHVHIAQRSISRNNNTIKTPACNPPSSSCMSLSNFDRSSKICLKSPFLPIKFLGSHLTNSIDDVVLAGFQGKEIFFLLLATLDSATKRA